MADPIAEGTFLNGKGVIDHVQKIHQRRDLGKIGPSQSLFSLPQKRAGVSISFDNDAI